MQEERHKFIASIAAEISVMSGKRPDGVPEDSYWVFAGRVKGKMDA